MASTPALGKADWTDFTDYWRDLDATWLMERSILRYADDAGRDTDWPTPTAGQVVFNAAIDGIQIRGASAWGNLLAVAHLVGSSDSSQVILSFDAASNQGLSLQTSKVVTTLPFETNGGQVRLDSTGVSVKTGTATAKLTTDATGLLVDKPIAASGALTATGLVINSPGTASFAGLITANSGINVTGQVTQAAAPTAGSHLANKTYVDTKLPLAGGTMTGQLVINLASGTRAINMRADNVYLDFYNSAGTSRYGYIQGQASAMVYVADDATKHVFNVAGGTKLNVDTAGADVTGNLTVSGTAAVNGIFYGVNGRFGGNGSQISLIDTVGGGNAAYMSFYGSGTTTTPGPRIGYLGYPSSTTLSVINESSAGHIRLATTGAGDIVLNPGAGGEIWFDPNNVFQGKMSTTVFMWGKAASDLANAGIEMYGSTSSAEGSIRTTTEDPNIQNLYCRHQGAAASSGQAFIHFANGSTVVGSVTQNGAAGTLYNTTSDYRVKEIHGEVDSALDRLMTLHPLLLSMIGEHTMFDGFLAHEVQGVVPYAVTGEKDAVEEDGSPKLQQLDMTQLVPLLVAAVQELSMKVDALT